MVFKDRDRTTFSAKNVVPGSTKYILTARNMFLLDKNHGDPFFLNHLILFYFKDRYCTVMYRCAHGIW